MSFYKSKFYHEFLSRISTTIKTIRRNFKNTKFEPEVDMLPLFIDKSDVCIDVGGAYGRYALPLSRMVGKEGKIYSFEPGKYSFDVLSFIKFFHRLNNVIINKLALSDHEGKINLCAPVKETGKVGASMAYISKEEKANSFTETVQMTTLDIFIAKNNIQKVDFIKCDTEGSELLVYRGAQKTIDAYHPTVLSEVEAGNLQRFGHTLKDLQDFFLNRDYRIFTLRQGRLSLQESITTDGNYFFVHASKMEDIKQ